MPLEKFGLEWDSLEEGYHIFLRNKEILLGKYIVAYQEKRKITTAYYFLGEDIHTQEGFKERRLSLGVHRLPLAIGD